MLVIVNFFDKIFVVSLSFVSNRIRYVDEKTIKKKKKKKKISQFKELTEK